MSIEMLRSFRSAVALRSLMVVVTLCSSLLAVKATEPVPTAADHLTPQSIAALTVKPAQLLSHPSLALLPTEVLEAASQKFLGISSKSIGRITAIAEPPLGMQPYYAIVVDLTEPMSLAGLSDEVLDELNKVTTSTSLNGRPLFESNEPALPNLYMPNDFKLIVASKGMLNKMLKFADEEPSEVDQPNPLARAMNGGGGRENDAHLAVMLKPIQPLIQMGLMQVRTEVEPQYHKYLDMVSMLNGVVGTLDMSGQRNSYLRVYTNSEEEADKLDDLVSEGWDDLRDKTFNNRSVFYASMAASEDPLQQAVARYLERLREHQINTFRPKRFGEKSFSIVNGAVKDGMSSPGILMSVIGVMVATLIPAVQSALEAAKDAQSEDSSKY